MVGVSMLSAFAAVVASASAASCSASSSLILNTAVATSGFASSSRPSSTVSRSGSGLASGTASGTATPSSVKPSRPVSSSAAGSTASASISRSSASASSQTGTRYPSESCPAYTPTTRTKSTTFYIAETVFPDPSTTTFTFYTSTVTPYVTATETGTLTIEKYLYSTTSLTAFTTTVVEVLPADTTVTIPTPNGFTPLKCLARYYDPTVTIGATTSITYTQNHYEYVTASTPTTDFTQTKFPNSILETVTIDSTTTIYDYPLVTETSTRAEATSTVYAACAAINVSPEAPVAPDDIEKYVYVPAKESGITESFVPSLGPADCCALCHANSSCATSAYYAKAQGLPPCSLYIKQDSLNQTCDPLFTGATRIIGTSYDPFITISNGACGQYLFDFPRDVTPSQ